MPHSRRTGPVTCNESPLGDPCGWRTESLLVPEFYQQGNFKCPRCPMGFMTEDGSLTSFDQLLGHTLTKVEKLGDQKNLSDEIWFHLGDDEVYALYHEYECCEEVYVEDICGELSALVGSPILVAEEVSNGSEEDGVSITWTFYKLATVNDYVTIRWCGSSSGEYSEKVDWRRVYNY